MDPLRYGQVAQLHPAGRSKLASPTLSDRLVVLARGQGDSVLTLRASHPAVARLASMHDTSGQYPMMAKEKAAPLKA